MKYINTIIRNGSFLQIYPVPVNEAESDLNNAESVMDNPGSRVEQNKLEITYPSDSNSNID